MNYQSTNGNGWKNGRPYEQFRARPASFLKIIKRSNLAGASQINYVMPLPEAYSLIGVKL